MYVKQTAGFTRHRHIDDADNSSRLSHAVSKELEAIRIDVTQLQSQSLAIQGDTSYIRDDASARKKAELMSRICSTDYFQQHRDFIARHLHGTGEWFLSTMSR